MTINKNKIIAIVAGLALTFSFVGCQIGPNGGRTFTPLGKIGAHIGTSVVVGRFCDNNPQHAPRVAEIAAEVRKSAEAGGFLSVDAVMTAVNAKIDWTKLEREGIAADVRELLAALGDELKTRLTGTTLGGANPDTLLTIADIARWIEDSARRSIASAPTP